MLSIWLIGYYGAALIFLLWTIIRKKQSQPYIWILLAIPFAGIFISLFLIHFVPRKPNRDIEKWMAKLDAEMKLEKIMYEQTNVQKDINVVPLIEALSFSSYKNRRRLLLDTLKDDAIDNQALLELAVANEDTETSHYAVSAITDFRGKLMVELQSLAVKYEQQPNNSEVLRDYKQALHHFINSKFIDDRTKRQYQHTYIKVLDQLTKLPGHTESDWRDKIDCEIELGLYDQAKIDCQHFRQQHDHSEDPYMLELKLHYIMRSKHEFEHTLSELRKSPVRLSNAALTQIRYWMTGVPS